MYDHFDGGIGMSNYIGRGIDQIDNVSTLDNLSFNGSDATFNLTQNSTAFTPVSADALQIQIDGIIQSGNYTVSGSTVTFDFTPSGSSVCNGIKHFGVGVLTTPSDASVTEAKIGTGAVTQAKLGAEAVNESKMQISNAGTNGQYLQKQSGNTGGLTWADAGATADNYFASSGLSSKDLGVGLHIKVADSSASVNNDGDDLVIENGESGIMAGMSILSATNGYGGISFGDSGSNTIGQMYYYHTNNSMHFKTNSVERLRLAGDGEVSINDSFADTNANGQFKVKGSLDETTCKFYHGSTSGSQNLFVFYDKDVENCGSISINASANTVAYNTSSDYRLKENETALTDGITRLKQLKPYRFNWKADSDGDKVDGFFAHEVSSIVPEAIHGEKDAMTTDDDGKTVINPQQIDQAKLVPLLTGALQEAITKIETLETKVEALENK
jgi:hypothetical protein